MPDRAADERLEQLVDHYAAILRSHLAQQCPRALGVATADVEQDAVIRLMRALRADRAADLYRIAVTTAVDAVRRAVARREEKLIDGRLGRRENAAPLLEALAQLPAHQRRCVALHLQGFDTGDIAALLRCSESKARKLVDRGLDSIHSAMQPA